VKNADGKRRERTEKEREGRSQGKAAGKSGGWAAALQERPPRKAGATKERAGLKPGTTNTKARKDYGNLVWGYNDDSRFSAISSILVTEFQLRPVPGVFRIL
jgi:hypothetical protein